jgi:hypothetical protein
MYTNVTLNLSKVEDLIRQFSNETNIWKNWQKWLLWADIHHRDLWKHRRNGSFSNYMKVVWGYESSQAYTIVKAGYTIELLLNHPEFATSPLSLPDTLESAANLGKHPDEKIFSVWRDCDENNQPIPPVAMNLRGKSQRTLKIAKALENLKLMESLLKI